MDSRARNPKALVVDDDPLTRMMAVSSLQTDGLDTYEAENGALAIEVITASSPDIVLLDVLMPVMDGFDACREIRALPSCEGLPVLMMTGLDDQDSIGRAYEAGATDFITKPINWLLLRNRVRYMLRASDTLELYRRSLDRNKAIIQSLPDIVMMLAPDGTILELKCHYEEGFLYPARDVIGCNVSEYLPPQDCISPSELVRRCVEHSGFQMAEYTIGAGGEARYFEARFMRIGKDEALAVIRNITARKRDEQRLLQYQENLETLVAERTRELTITVNELQREVAERKRISETLALLDKATKTTRTGITICGSDRKIIYVNPADAEMHGYSVEEVLGQDMGLFAPDNIQCPLSHKELQSVTTWSRESLNMRKDGSVFPVKLVSDVVKDDSGSVIGMVTICEDITEAKKAQEELNRYQSQLEELVEERTNELTDMVGKLESEVDERKRKENMIMHMAYFDSLTGLPNRAYLNEHLRYALKNADDTGSKVGLMYIDLDNFKRINDTLGHSMGDVLLKDVGIRLNRCLRRTDQVLVPNISDAGPVVSRLGGDEFIILLPDLEDPADAVIVARRIMNSMSMPFELESHEIFVTPSIGITYYPIHGTDVDSLLMKADTAMYQAKEQGKNGYMIYEDAMSEAVMRRLVLENDLHRAIDRNELQLYYQPLMDIRTGEVVKMEALLRWFHPKHGDIPRSDFIPIAEQHGLIVPIGDWVLNTVISELTAWLSRGMAPVPVVVNLSVNQFVQHNVVKQIKNLIDRHGLDPGLLEVEITESSLMKNPEETITRLGLLKSMGVKISIDDFGTGYSSLSYLRKLPLDTLKVDRSFVQDISISADAESIIKAIVSMGHSMNLKVVAEGVETRQQLDFLKALGCDMVQGYYYSKPMPVCDVTGFLSSVHQRAT